jgi:hypothetical protein
MNKNKEVSSAMIIPVDNIADLRCVKLFSEFCEATCDNLFAYSPYQLHLDREEFLHFQFLADELKNDLENGEVSFDELYKLCLGLNEVYVNLVCSCWAAYKYNNNKDGEPGKFVVRQIKIVSDFIIGLETGRI